MFRSVTTNNYDAATGILTSFTFQGKEYTGMNFMINHKGKPTKTQVTNFRDQLEKKYFGNKIGDTPTN